MDLEKFKQNKKLKKSFYAIGIVILLLITTILLYRSYALYQNNHEYNVIKGVIPDFGYDVKFAIKIDDKEATSVPERKANNGNYYKVEADCGENTKAEWDYNAWNLKVDNIKSNSKCNLTFTSNLSETEYEKYIESGIEYRRNTYRGKDITNLKTSGELYNQIGNCTFDDIYVGDYILSDLTDQDNKKIKWLIADINNYLHTGSPNIDAANGYKSKEGTGLKACHATIIPAGSLGTGRMNSTNTSEGGYLGSEMVKEANKSSCIYSNYSYTCNTLTSVLNEYVLKDFSTHVIEYRNLLSNAIDPDRSNQYGSDGGASSDWQWVSRKIDLMSEVNVYGSTVWSSSGYDIGIDNRQYAIFRLKPDLINTDGNGNGYWYWLKAVTSRGNFANVRSSGDATSDYVASYAGGGIRPRFLID